MTPSPIPTIPDRLSTILPQLVAEFQAGASYREMCTCYGCSPNTLRLILRGAGVDTSRKRPGACRPSVHRAENRANGDDALRARPCKRIPCPHGQMSDGKLRICTMSEDGHCEACRDSYNVARGIVGTSMARCLEVGVASVAKADR